MDKNIFPMQSTAAYSTLLSLAEERILLLDGGMGTMIQRFNLTEKDFLGHKGNNDILVLSRPDVVEKVHLEYLESGADIIETCTFNSNAISQADYGLESECYKFNKTGAEIAKRAVEKYRQGKPCLSGSSHSGPFVAGSIGPTSKAAGMASKVEDPANRGVTFRELANA